VRLFEYLQGREDGEPSAGFPAAVAAIPPSETASQEAQDAGLRFTVYAIDQAGEALPIATKVDAEYAGTMVRRMIRSINAQLGLIERVRIADGGLTVFEWHWRRGVVFPRHLEVG
jgi:hypothetical protein